MTTKQIAWAATHDWYVDKSKDNDAVLVEDRWTENGELHWERRWFDDFSDLREWAGY